MWRAWPDGGEPGIATGLVRLRLERELHVVSLRDGVLADEVQRLAIALERILDALRGLHLLPLAAAPEHVDRRAELGAEIDSCHRLLQREATDARIVRGERAILERGQLEEVRRRHRDDQPGSIERGTELVDDAVALARAGADGHEIVVVQRHAVRPELGQLLDGDDRIEGWPGRVAERIAPGVPDGPESEREPIARSRHVRGLGHHCSLLVRFLGVRQTTRPCHDSSPESTARPSRPKSCSSTRRAARSWPRARRPHVVTGEAGARETPPEVWWDALRHAVASTGRGSEVAAISVAGQQHGLVVLGEDGRPLRPAILWNDTRSAPDAARLTDLLGGPEASAARLGSVPVASFTATSWLWLRREEPDLAAQVARVRLPHDYMTERLSGGAVTDRGDASGTGWWSPLSETYDDGVLELDRPRSREASGRPRSDGGGGPGHDRGGGSDRRPSRGARRLWHGRQHGRRPRPRRRRGHSHREPGHLGHRVRRLDDPDRATRRASPPGSPTRPAATSRSRPR